MPGTQCCGRANARDNVARLQPLGRSNDVVRKECQCRLLFGPWNDRVHSGGLLSSLEIDTHATNHRGHVSHISGPATNGLVVHFRKFVEILARLGGPVHKLRNHPLVVHHRVHRRFHRIVAEIFRLVARITAAQLLRHKPIGKHSSLITQPLVERRFLGIGIRRVDEAISPIDGEIVERSKATNEIFRFETVIGLCDVVLARVIHDRRTHAVCARERCTTQ